MREAVGALQEHIRQEGPMAILRTDGGGEFGGRFARPRIYMFDEDTGVLAVCNMHGVRKEETVALESDMMGKAEATSCSTCGRHQRMEYFF